MYLSVTLSNKTDSGLLRKLSVAFVSSRRCVLKLTLPGLTWDKVHPYAQFVSLGIDSDSHPKINPPYAVSLECIDLIRSDKTEPETCIELTFILLSFSLCRL